MRRPGSIMRVDVGAFAHRFCQPADRRDRQRDAGTGSGQFPRVGFVAAGGTYRQRQNIDAVKVHGLEASADGPRAVALQAGASCTHARMRHGRRGRLARRPASGADAKFRRDADRGCDQDGKGAQFVLRRVGAQFEDDLNTRYIKGCNYARRLRVLATDARLQMVARAETSTNLVMAGLEGDGSVERATPRTLWRPDSGFAMIASVREAGNGVS